MIKKNYNSTSKKIDCNCDQNSNFYQRNENITLTEIGQKLSRNFYTIGGPSQ